MKEGAIWGRDIIGIGGRIFRLIMVFPLTGSFSFVEKGG
jgi:hypothetical protein